MKKKIYQELSVGYFNEHISVLELTDALKEGVSMEVENAPFPDERIMLITNHPRADDDLSLPAEEISGLKGGNTKNFPDFWFPIVRQTMLLEALGHREFSTVAFDIGWKVAMEEMGHILIDPNGQGRCQEVISWVNGAQKSLAFFPEGGARDVEFFHRGFYYIARELGIKRLVLGAFSPVLSLQGENILRILHTENMDFSEKNVDQFVEKQRQRIKSAVG